MPVTSTGGVERAGEEAKASASGGGVRLVVCGGRGVGKSALAVRFLTRRFIGEYQHAEGR